MSPAEFRISARYGCDQSFLCSVSFLQREQSCLGATLVSESEMKLTDRRHHTSMSDILVQKRMRIIQRDTFIPLNFRKAQKFEHSETFSVQKRTLASREMSTVQEAQKNVLRSDIKENVNVSERLPLAERETFM